MTFLRHHPSRNGARPPPAAALAAALAAAVLACPAGARAQQAARGVRVRLELENEQRDVLLLGRRGNALLYRPPSAPAGVSAELDVRSIAAGEFALPDVGYEAEKAARERRYVAAAQIYLKAVSPALPFLDLPGNNAAEPAMAAGRLLYRAARIYGERDGDGDRATAKKLFETAYTVLKACAAASWHPYARHAEARSALCLVETGRMDDAARVLDGMREPAAGDAAYGIFWFARARLRYERGDAHGALDAAIQSVLYENKDVETFPAALMLCALCYEDILEIHRTRDIYYEVARLFQGTEWAEKATAGLRVIMDEGLADAPEEQDAARVFFGVAEDMNQIVRDFLAARPAATELDEEQPSETREPKEGVEP